MVIVVKVHSCFIIFLYLRRAEPCRLHRAGRPQGDAPTGGIY